MPYRGDTEPAPSSAAHRDPVQDAERFVGDDRFLVQRRLGAGAFGVVYEAYDRVEKALVALKVLRVADADALYRFKKGFRSLADLRHPNLVSFYELTIHEGLWFFSMELIAGRELTEALGILPASESGSQPALGTTDYPRVRYVMRQLASGLQAVHQSGRVHRDIKPPNVLVTAADRVKLLDFGLATELGGRHSIQIEPQLVGTPAYMAPEQADGLPGSPASDWYSVGVMLYQVLTGELPFEGSLIEIVTGKQRGLQPETLRRLAPRLPDDLERLCLGLLEPDPDRRLVGPDLLNLLGDAWSSTPGNESRPTTGTGLSDSGTYFVGRDEHIDRLDAALDISRQRGVVVQVCGPSGIGKSALVRRFVDRVEGRHPDAVVLTGRCYVQESVPYKAVDSLIDALSRSLMGLKRAEAEALLPDRIAELSRLFPVLRRVPAVADVPVGVDLDDDLPEIRRRAFGALHELLARLAADRLVVLTIDDLQWGDLDSFELLDQLFQSPEPLPLLFIGCYRSEEATTSPFLQALGAEAPRGHWGSAELQTLELGELSASEGRQLLARLGGLCDSDEVTALLEESAGSPLYLSEVARFAGGRPSGESAVAAGSGTIGRLQGLILDRVDQLGPAARRLLDVVSVAGQPLPLDVALAAASLDGGGVSAVAELRAERLARVAQVEEVERIETYHDRVREAVTGRLGAAGLKRLHGDLARALESSGDAAPETLAVHFRATAEDERARRYAVTAAERAESALAFDRAARLYRLAIDLLPEGADERYDLHVRLALALGNAGRNRHAAETLLQAVGESGTVDPLESQRFAAEKLLISGHIDRGLSVLRHVLRTVEMELDPQPWRTLIRLWWWRTRLRVRGFDFVERHESEIDPEVLRRIDVCWSAEIGLCLVDVLHASEFHARHLLLALRAGEPQRIARGLAMEVFFGAMEGVSVPLALERARELAGRVEGRYAASLAEMAAGMAACSKGAWTEAERRLTRAEMHLLENRRGVSWELDTVRQFRAVARVHLGLWREMFTELPMLLEQAREQEDLYLETHLHLWVEGLRDLCADRAEAAALALADADAWSDQGFHYQHFSRLAAEVRIDLYRRRGLDAWSKVDRHWQELTNSMLQRIEMVLVQSHDLRGRAAIAAAAESAGRGDSAAVDRYLAEAESSLQVLGKADSDWARGLTASLRAGVHSVRGETAFALGRLALAEEAFELAEMVLYVASVRRRRAQLLGDLDMLASADAIFLRHGVSRPTRMVYVSLPGRWPDV